MSILSTVKKGYLYMKTSSGYLKLLPRTLASLVSLDNGNSVETEISSIKSEASKLSSTVSGHTTTLNSHGSSISAIKTKTDALKNAANKTVANNLTTTADGYVLDARMGKSLQDSITTLNSTSFNVEKLNVPGESTVYVKKYSNGYFESFGHCLIDDLNFSDKNQMGSSQIYYAQFVNAPIGIDSKTITSIECSVNNTGVVWIGNISTYNSKSLKGTIMQYGKTSRNTDLYFTVIGTWK